MDEYYVAYLDLLGSTKKIEDDDKNNTDTWLNAIHTIYQETFNAISALDAGPGQIEMNLSKIPLEFRDIARESCNRFRDYPVETKIFSDNVIFAIKVPTEDSDKRYFIYRLYSIVSYFQMYSLCKYQWMLRGGITCGKLHIEKDYFIWGKALIDACALAEKKDTPPRVCVDNNFVNIHMELFMDNYFQSILPNSPLIQDKYEKYFVGYEHLIHDQNNFFKLDGKKWLKFFQEALLKMLKEHANDQSIMKKVRWAIDYHNKVCSDVMADLLKVV